MLFLTGVSCLIFGIWLGKRLKNRRIRQYKSIMNNLIQKADQMNIVIKALTEEVKYHRRITRSKEIEKMQIGVIDAATELMVEI